MSQVCKNCGAMLADGERLCTNCGKVAPKERKAAAKSENQFSAINQTIYENKQLSDVKRQFSPTMTASNQMLSKERRRYAEKAAQKADYNANAAKRRHASTKSFDEKIKEIRPTEIETTSGNEKKSSLHPIINKIAWIVIALIAIYFTIGGIVIMVYRNATYDFGIQGSDPLVADTYAQAMHNYFDSGWWHFRLTSGVTYVGKTADGDKYELHFTKKDGERFVDKVLINGEEVESDSLMKSIIMPMFMADEKP